VKPTAKPGDAKVSVIGNNLELQGKIGASIYANVTGSLSVDDIRVITTINGEEIDSEVETSDNRIVVTTFVKPKELHDQITVEFRRADNDQTIKLASGKTAQVYSVADIAKSYQNKKYGQETRELAEAILNFGSYAQKLLKYDTSSAVVTDKLSDVTKNDVADYKAVKKGKVSGITYIANGLGLEADTALDTYFLLDDGEDIADYSFTLNGKQVAPREDGNGIYIIEIDGIKAKDLGKENTILVQKGKEKLEVRASALSWSQQVLGSKGFDTATVNMAKMVYRYSQKADAYFKAGK
jgi:hypothetical protein